MYYSKLEIPLGLERNGSIDSNALIHDKDEAFSSSYELPWNFTTGRRSLSSDAGARSSGEEDDLESIETSLHSEEELSCDEGDIEGAELELLSEAGKTPGSRRSSELFKAIVSVSGLSVATAIDKWVEEGKEINRTEIANAMLQLRRRRMYGRALQVHIAFLFHHVLTINVYQYV